MNTPPLPDRTYRVIYADPPWKYDNTLGDQARWGAATSAYPCMPLEDICAMDVPSLADPVSCALFMWTTCPKQPEAHEVLRAWGFRYVTIPYIWVKLRPNAPRTSPYRYSDLYYGRGRYTGPNAELIMLAVRGLSPDVYETGQPQIVFEPRSEHSRKPPVFRSLIERLLGPTPRIELFARSRAPGWDAWGNQVDAYEE